MAEPTKTHCPHRCDEQCVCPACNAPLLYSAARDQHACSDRSCRYAAGTPDIVELYMAHRFARIAPDIAGLEA